MATTEGSSSTIPWPLEVNQRVRGTQVYGEPPPEGRRKSGAHIRTSSHAVAHESGAKRRRRRVVVRASCRFTVTSGPCLEAYSFIAGRRAHPGTGCRPGWSPEPPWRGGTMGSSGDPPQFGTLNGLGLVVELAPQRGRPTWRWNTASWWRKTRISASFEKASVRWARRVRASGGGAGRGTRRPRSSSMAERVGAGQARRGGNWTLQAEDNQLDVLVYVAAPA
jgi:hypothetical protein